MDDNTDFLKNIIQLCHTYQIDGLVLKQDEFTSGDKKTLETIRNIDKEQQLIVISEGKSISSGKEVIERLEAGATLTTTRDPIFTSKGPCAVADIKREIRKHLKDDKNISDINKLFV